MAEKQYDSKLVEKAKKAMAGPLGIELVKFPLRFALPIFWGTGENKARINNGTASLVDFGDGPIAITCFHVIDGYRRRLADGEKLIFQIGNYKFDPNIIAECADQDLATIDMRSCSLSDLEMDREIGTSFFRPTSWPPAEVHKGDFILTGGFPGRWRNQRGRMEIEFGTFSLGASEVHSVTDGHISCAFQKDYWVENFGVYGKDDLGDLGGISGAPVFIKRQICFELIGIVTEFSPGFEILRIRRTNSVRPDGLIHD